MNKDDLRLLFAFRARYDAGKCHGNAHHEYAAVAARVLDERGVVHDLREHLADAT